MPTTYTPTANALTTLTLPSDGDFEVVASVNSPFEDLADAVALLQGHVSNIYVTNVTTTPVAWTAGPNDTLVRLRGWGGGGGGGGGVYGFNAINVYSGGGGGGGGSLERTIEVAVTPGAVYELVAGAAGSGGAGGVYSSSTAAGSGGAGGDSVFRAAAGGAVLATFKGATGGKSGDFAIGTGILVVPGGTPTVMSRNRAYTNIEPNFSFCFGPGFGGDGISAIGGPVGNGAASREGFAGGAAGFSAAAGGSYQGGGAGGGGAGGPGGSGDAGKSGGAGASSGSGSSAPSSGTGYVGGTGAGGGGGGGGGSGPSGGGNGSAGDPGDTGFISLRVIG